MEIFYIIFISIFIVGVATVRADCGFEPRFFMIEVMFVSMVVGALCLLA